MDELELTTVEAFEIKGRGIAHTVVIPPGERSEEWLGTTVLLDGERVRVVGVERPPIRGMTAILVRPED